MSLGHRGILMRFLNAHNAYASAARDAAVICTSHPLTCLDTASDEAAGIQAMSGDCVVLEADKAISMYCVHCVVFTVRDELHRWRSNSGQTCALNRQTKLCEGLWHNARDLRSVCCLNSGALSECESDRN